MSHPYRSNRKYVYIMSEEGTDFYRIGVSNWPKKRLESLKTGNPREITVIYARNFDKQRAKIVESLLHDQFSDFMALDGWFKLSDEKLNEAIRILNVQYSIAS